MAPKTPPAADDDAGATTLPPEVEAQLTAAADQLEAALARAEAAEAELADVRGRLTEASAEIRLLRELNADLSARLAAAPSGGPVPTLAGDTAEPRRLLTPALRPLLSKGVKVTVKRGRLEHPRADNGVAAQGESFFVTKEEAEGLRASLAPGVVEIE